MNLLLETLYKQQTQFLESDFEKLFSVIRNRISNRSLLILFTNFESVESLQREMDIDCRNEGPPYWDHQC